MNFDFDQACKIAYEYYKEAWKTVGLNKISDLGEKWIFYPKVTEVNYGSHHITISKINGEIKPFVLPNKDNFELLKNATSVDVPEEYKE